MPPGYEAYAASLDITGVDAEDYALLRTYLTRSHVFTPDARWSLAVRLQDRLAAKAQTAVPPGVHPEWFLHIIGAAYQRRYRSAP